jgi:polysaccharide export outer membrane protein
MWIAQPFRTTVTALLFLGLLSFMAQQQMAQEQPKQFKVRSEPKVISPEDIVRQFEAPELVSYTLGKGDEITVEIWNHPELSGKHVVGPDGRITLPVAGVISVLDLTREDAQKEISSAYARFYSDLAVTVRVDRYTSYRIFILGRVGNPGALQFDSQPTLLDVVTRAASLPIGGIGADKAGLGRCAIIRGRDQMIWVDLKVLLTQGNMALNIRLARNDLVYMPDAGDQLVYVLGEVKHPGAFRLTPTMSFLDAFTQAGGLTEDAAEDKIEVVRSTSGVQREFRLKDLLTEPQALNFALEEGDIIYAPRRNLAKFGYVLQKTSSLAAFAVLGTVGVK